MAKKFSNALAVVLLLIGLVAALPLTGVFTKATCTWETSTQTTTSLAPGDKALTSLALLVRSGDAALTPALRADLIEGLKSRGVTDIADNPVTWPRADVTVTEVSGRYTPFYAPLTMRTRVILDRKKGGGGVHAVDATIEVTGRCTGLVGKDEWMAGPRRHVVAAVLDRLMPATPAR